MNSHIDDRALLMRIANNEQIALRSLFARYQLRIYRFVMRFVRNEAIAEEITNEVFLEIWRNAGRYEGRSAPSTWMLSIARNRAISSLRKRTEENWDDDYTTTLADDADDPEVESQKTDKAAVLRDCIAKLSAEHREVIDLVYYHEKSIAEISEITGVPPATVKTRMHYARKKLSGIMQDAGVDRGWP